MVAVKQGHGKLRRTAVKGGVQFGRNADMRRPVQAQGQFVRDAGAQVEDTPSGGQAPPRYSFMRSVSFSR